MRAFPSEYWNGRDTADRLRGRVSSTGRRVRYRTGAGSLRHDSLEAAQDRRGGTSDRATRVGLVVWKLSVPGVVSPGARQSAAVENATASGPCVNRRRPVHVPKFERPIRLSDALAAARTTRNRLPHEPLPALYAPHPCHFSLFTAQPRSNEGNYHERPAPTTATHANLSAL